MESLGAIFAFLGCVTSTAHFNQNKTGVLLDRDCKRLYSDDVPFQETGFPNTSLSLISAFAGAEVSV